MKPKPTKRKFKMPPATTTVTLAKVRKVTVEDVERLFRFEASEKQQPPLLFCIYIDKAWMHNENVYRYLYENKILTWDTNDPQKLVCNFSHKDDAKFLRNELIRNGFPAHVSYGPDHRRVLGEIK